jgi:hypothetical protein
MRYMTTEVSYVLNNEVCTNFASSAVHYYIAWLMKLTCTGVINRAQSFNFGKNSVLYKEIVHL